MLNETPKEIKERKALVINPAKTCQPIGAMYAALGIHRCLPHSHGSQGCCAYHRMHLTRHYRDPIVASTSSFTEGACVFGGKSNLKTGLANVFHIYDPDVVAINTTCLSETIGDDIGEIVRDSKVPEGKTVIFASTPSYQGSHVTGFSNMNKAMITHLVDGEKTEPNGKVAVFPGYVEPSDMAEVKRIIGMMDVPFTMLPDTSGVVNTPNTGKYEMYPEGGTKVEDIKDLKNCSSTIAMGSFSSKDAAYELEKIADVEANVLNVPIGIQATDNLVMKIMEVTGKDISKELEFERGQLVDLMTDVHFHYHGKSVALFGDPDILLPLAEFVISLGMIPKYVLTGTPGKAFEEDVTALLKEHGLEDKCTVKMAADLFELHQWIKNDPVDMLIGNTYGKYIARAENIPLVRVGFPILDRVGHSLFPIVGYKGAMRLIEKISTAFLDKYDRECAEEDFELVM